AAERGEQPSKEPVLVQFLLGHEANPATGDVSGEEDVHQRPVRRRDDERAGPGDSAPAAHAHKEDRLERRQGDGAGDAVEDPLPEVGAACRARRPDPEGATDALQRSTIPSTTSSTVRPVVSITTASAAGASGVVRWSSASRRSTASRTESRSAGRAAACSSR